MYNHPPEGGKTLTELKTKIFNKIDMNMEFDETKENDKEYLKEYYQSRIDYWKDKPNSDLIVKRYEKGLKKLNK